MQLRSCGMYLFILGLGISLASNVYGDVYGETEKKTDTATDQGPIVEEVVTDLKTGQKIEVKEKKEGPPVEKKAAAVAEKPSAPVAEVKPREITSTAEKPKGVETNASDTAQPSVSTFVGHIVILNQEKNFVVVDFERGVIPPVRSELGVYRNDIFVGSIRITDQIKSPMVVADILTGTLRQGDTVR